MPDVSARTPLRVHWHLLLGHKVTKYTPTEVIAGTQILNFCQTCKRFV